MMSKENGACSGCGKMGSCNITRHQLCHACLEGALMGLTFYDCLMECVGTPELIEQFDRLNGTNLLLKGSPFALKIDEVTGRQKDDLRKFIDFCWEYIWSRLGSAGIPVDEDKEGNNENSDS